MVTFLYQDYYERVGGAIPRPVPISIMDVFAGGVELVSRASAAGPANHYGKRHLSAGYDFAVKDGPHSG
jgi:hypothetical protein